MEQNRILKISLISVLSYVIFLKSYDFLYQLLFWLVTEFQISNNNIILIINLIIGLISLWVLYLLYYQFLSKGKHNMKMIYILIGILIILSATVAGLNYAQGIYLTDKMTSGFRDTRLYLYSIGTGIEYLIGVLGLIMFLVKIKVNELT